MTSTEYLAPIELKFVGDSAERTFTGYGATFGGIDSFGDRITKGAFKRTLSEAKAAGRFPPMLMQHGFAASGLTPLGIWTKMAEDDRGLLVEGRLSETPSGMEAYTLLKDGALSGLSIGFVARKSTFGTKPKEPRRTLTDIDLVECSLCTFPVNDLARVTNVKSDLTAREIERLLIAGGVPRSFAKTLLSGGFKAANQSDDTEQLDALVAAVRAGTASLARKR